MDKGSCLLGAGTNVHGVALTKVPTVRGKSSWHEQNPHGNITDLKESS